MEMGSHAYRFENARSVQEQRLAALGELLDPGTIRYLDGVGVAAGWQCAEPDPRLDSRRRELFVRAVEASNATLAEVSGFDAAYRRRVAGDLAEVGLVECECEAHAGTWFGGQAGGEMWRLTFAQLREPMIASGRVSDAEVEELLALCEDPALRFLSQVTVAAWGQRASA